MVGTHMILKTTAFMLPFALLATASYASPSSSCDAAGSGATRLSNGKNFPVSSSSKVTEKSLAELMCIADRGDPSAQLALGLRYEKGEGVPADPTRAARLYAQAERTITRLVMLNSPPTRSGRFSVTRMSGNRPLPVALAEARYRLGRLYLDGRGVKKDRGYGRRLLIDSARQDYAPAIAVLKGQEPAVPYAPDASVIKEEGLE
jgi:TPR repeat protein